MPSKKNDSGLLLSDSSPVPALEFSLEGKLIYANRAFCELVQATPEELAADGWFSLIEQSQRENLRQRWYSIVLDQSPVVPTGTCWQLKNGQQVWLIPSINWSLDSAGKPLSITVTVGDITELKQASARVDRSERRYRNLFDSTLDTVFSSTLDGRLLDINPAGLASFGFKSKEQALSIDLRGSYAKPQQREALVEKLLTTGEAVREELHLKKLDGETMIVQATASLVTSEDGSPPTVHGILRDFTEERRLQQQRIETAKVDAAARLAGGIAHDFNNLLTIIEGSTELLLLDKEDLPPSALELVDQIRDAAKRGGSLTSRLTSLSRSQVTSRVPLDLNQVLRNLGELIAAAAGEKIEVSTSYSLSEAVIMGDQTQLEQVVMNLIINARDAVEEARRDTGKIAISIEAAGERIILKVSDNGCGMDEETQAQIFDPFFTTKSPGKGTGLGLSSVSSIVQNLRGRIDVQSLPKQGCLFRLSFPRSSSKHKATAVSQEAQPRGRVLLADDDDGMRRVVSNYLSAKGFSVVSARNGAEALELLEGPTSFSVLVSDVLMPELGGLELLQELQSKSLELPTILMSGYMDSAEALQLEEFRHSGVRFLAKPFSAERLVEALDNILEGYAEAAVSSALGQQALS